MEHICEQYGDEWVRLRLGKPTASGFHHIITPTGKATTGLMRRKYLYRLVTERLLGQMMDDNHESKWMSRGSELEPAAVAALCDSLPHISSIRKVGFFMTPDRKAGSSPDGMIVNRNGATDEEVVEVKCPAPSTHVGYLIDGPGADYKAQVQGHLWITGAKVAHFFAWHPSMPRVHEVRKRDEHYISILRDAVYDFCKEIDDAEAFCRGKGQFRLAEQLRLSDEMAAGMME